MCQNIQWIVSKFGEVVMDARIRILAMFRIKSVVRAVRVASARVFGLMFAVEKMSIRRR